MISHEIKTEEHASEQDLALMDETLAQAYGAMARGGVGVAALLAYSDDIIARGCNASQETGNLTDHAEMVLLRKVGRRLQEMNEHKRRSLSLYVTLEPCLMCSAALSFVGIRRIVYAALAEDANSEQMIVHELTLPKFNQQLVRGPFILVPGIRRAEGQALLRSMKKQAGAPADLKS